MRTAEKTEPWVQLLMWLYFPILGFSCLIALLCGIGLMVAGGGHHRFIRFFFFFLPAFVLFGMVVHVLISLRPLFTRIPHDDEMEIGVPKQWIRWLYDLCDDLSKKYNLPPPDDIRLHATDVAHVYEDEEGRKILAIGGLALAGFTDDALAGVIAHELGHFAAGDTKLGRVASKWLNMHALMEYQFGRHWSSSINPFTWGLRGYHALFRRVYFAHMRAAEFDADRREIEHVGPEQCARTCILLEAVEYLPYAKLISVAETCVAVRIPVPQVFSEQARRVRETSPGDWEDAFNRAIKARTKPFDTHPRLRDRLKATGVSKKRCRELAREVNQEGRPASDLINNWPAIEKVLSSRIVEVVQHIYDAKMEAAQVILGGPP